MQSYATKLDDGDVLPIETRELLLESAKRVQFSPNKARLKCEVVTGNNIKKKMKRAAWVLRDEHALNKLLQDLEDSSSILHLALQLLKIPNIDTKIDKQPVEVGISTTKGISTWPWLRQLGFYATLRSKSYSRWCLVDTDIFLACQFPTWLWSKSIDFQLHVQTPSFIRVQNRVQEDSPFMVACREDDMDRIRQHLANKSGSVGDRLICTGQTPLMLTIESGSISAVKMLLDAGADPCIGDDDGITPMFSALGMNPRRNKPFPKLPPKNLLWMDIIRLLAEHDASVHEIIYEKSLTTLNLVWHEGGNRTLEFFHFLQDQSYVDFGAQTKDRQSVCMNALRSARSNLQCVKFLETVGLDFARISTDARSLLHFAAEYAHDAEVIEYLCQICPSHHINRQDDLGWTPLHYSILFKVLHMPQDSLAKVKALVRRGVNPFLKATHLPTMKIIDKNQFTTLELSEALKSEQYEQFFAILRECGHEIPEEANENIFHETVDTLPIL